MGKDNRGIIPRFLLTLHIELVGTSYISAEDIENIFNERYVSSGVGSDGIQLRELCLCDGTELGEVLIEEFLLHGTLETDIGTH